MNKPLSGVKVVDCTFFVAGPVAGRILSDWGADVIKVEPPKGDPGRGMDPNDINADHNYSMWNAGKRGIVLNSKDPDGAVILYKLLDEADIFLTSYRTDALERMGLSWEALHERYPQLIWAQVTGFGELGPDASDPGFDTVAYWARTGAMADFVGEGHPPIIPPVAFGDANTGAILAGGIAAALYGREKTGKGEKVMVSLFGNALFNLSFLFWDVQIGNSYPKRHDGVPMALMNTFVCKDGKAIYIAVLEHERYYNTLMHLIGRDDLIDHPRYSIYSESKKADNQKELTQILDEGFLLHTRDEWDQILKEADIAHTCVRTSAEVLHDPQALANNYLVERTFRNGDRMMLTSTPTKFGNMDDDGFVDAPAKGGQDSIEILRELGYSDAQIRELIDRKVIHTIKEL